jgi:plasmid stability protein
MSASLSIKHVPDDVLERLRDRAKRNRRSLQGELLDVIERAANEPPVMTIEEVYERAKALGLSSLPVDSVGMIATLGARRAGETPHAKAGRRGKR